MTILLNTSPPCEGIRYHQRKYQCGFCMHLIIVGFKRWQPMKWEVSWSWKIIQNLPNSRKNGIWFAECIYVVYIYIYICVCVCVSLNGGKTPISHPKCWSFLVGQAMVVGETHHFRKPHPSAWPSLAWHPLGSYPNSPGRFRIPHQPTRRAFWIRTDEKLGAHRNSAQNY